VVVVLAYFILLLGERPIAADFSEILLSLEEKKERKYSNDLNLLSFANFLHHSHLHPFFIIVWNNSLQTLV
jgi:hypothetical protein